jgi:hypothetical protein
MLPRGMAVYEKCRRQSSRPAPYIATDPLPNEMVSRSLVIAESFYIDLSLCMTCCSGRLSAERDRFDERFGKYSGADFEPVKKALG